MAIAKSPRSLKRAQEPRAAKRLAVINRKRRDPRYRRVLGRFTQAGLLSASEAFEPNRDALTVADVLWAGEIEPRLLEILPALIVKRPALFTSTQDLPTDLAEAVAALRRNQAPSDFRGLPGADIARWVPLIGHKNKRPSQLRSFRLQADDVELLDELSSSLGISQTDAVRRGLRALARQSMLGAEHA